MNNVRIHRVLIGLIIVHINIERIMAVILLICRITQDSLLVENDDEADDHPKLESDFRRKNMHRKIKYEC